MLDTEKNAVSVFRMISVGIVAVNKKRNEDTIEVFPIELTPFSDGELVPNSTELEDKGVDASGKPYTLKLTTSNTIEATWLPGNTNVKTSPNVRRGERVKIYQCGDEDKYYWRTMGLDNGLRRLESIIVAFSAHTDETVKEVDPEKSYFLELSTHDGHVTFSTSQANGEPFGYEVCLNTKEGYFQIIDTDDNHILFDSEARHIIAKNCDGSFMEINKKNIRLESKDRIDLKTTDFKMEAKTVVVECDTAEFTCTTSAKLTSAQTDIYSPVTIHENVIMLKNLNVTMLATVGGLAAGAGAMSVPVGGGSLAIAVPTAINGNVDTLGGLTNNGTNVGSTHQHNETGMGGGITTPPI